MIPHLFSFEKLEKDCVIFAGGGGILSATNPEHLSNPQHIVAPGVIYNNSLIIYHSFNGKTPRLYRIKNRAIYVKGQYIFKAKRSTGSRHHNIKEIIEKHLQTIFN